MARARFSRGDLLLLSAILAAAGLAVSGFLTVQFYTGFGSGACTINLFWNCETVRNSPWSSFAGIPTAAAGLGGFVILLGLSILGLRGVDRIGPLPLDVWLLGFAILGALIGFGLTLVEIFIIGALCIFCLSGFVLDLGVLWAAFTIRRSTPADARA